MIIALIVSANYIVNMFTWTTFSLSELQDKYRGSRIPYEELLRTPEWLDFRVPIIDRDGHKCTKCSAPETEYAVGRHVYWIKQYDNKVVSQQFWKKWEEFKKIPGNETAPFEPAEEDYIKVPEFEYETMVKVDAPVRLHVHHKYYLEGMWPWQYPLDSLVTLCNWCHAELHANEKVPYYRRDNEDLVEWNLTPCIRCNAAGFLPQYDYVENGICFRCHGYKYEELIP
jgi:hypothetical protein